MEIDTSGLDKLAADFERVPATMIPKVRGVVSKGALNIKNRMQADARESLHFKQIAPTIDYDLTVGEFFGDASVEAEIGPNPERGGAANLLGAYWGWSNGGGGTITDPAVALGEEESRFVEALAKIVGFDF